MAPIPRGATVAVTGAVTRVVVTSGIAATKMRFRPMDESIRDCVESLLSVAGVKPKLRPGFTHQI